MDIKQENGSFNSPKNKKQIGRIGKGDKIYIEDYAVTYLNQIARDSETQGGVAGLFGTCREVEGVKEYYIYAAVYQEKDKILNGGLPREVVQKIMRRRAEMFVEYFFLGWAFIIKEKTGTMWESCYRSRLETLMGKPELLMTLQCNTCEEHFYLYPTEMPKEAEGYFIFYEQNDAMQNFLIDWHGTNHNDKCDAGDQVAESCRNYYKEKRAERFRSRMAGVLLTATVLFLLFSAGVGIQNLNNYNKIKEAGQTMEETIYPVEEDIIVEDIILTTENGIKAEAEGTIKDLETETVAKEETALMEDITETEVKGDMISEPATEAESIPPETEKDGADSSIILTEEDTDSKETGVQESYITYEVCKGDTLYGICMRFYGNLSKASEICKLNNIENMDNILYGEKILLPQ